MDDRAEEEKNGDPGPKTACDESGVFNPDILLPRWDKDEVACEDFIRDLVQDKLFRYKSFITILDKGNQHNFDSLVDLLCKFIHTRHRGTPKIVERVLNKISRKLVDDGEILMSIAGPLQINTYEQDQGVKKGMKNPGNSFDFELYLSRIFKDTLNPERKYLDVGCGTVWKTMSVAGFLGIVPGNTYGTDTRATWLNSTKPKASTLFTGDVGNTGIVGESPKGLKYYYYKPNGVFPFEDSTFEVMTCFMTLHHLNEHDRLVMIRESYRCLTDNGTYILREHDVRNAVEYALAEVEHLCYEIGKSGSDYKQYQCVYYSEYHSRSYWIDQLESCGFKYTGDSFPNQDNMGPTRAVELIFKKKPGFKQRGQS